MDLELSDGTLIVDTVGEAACIFLAGLYRAEQAIAERMLGLANGKLPWPWIDPDKALPWVERKTGCHWPKVSLTQSAGADVEGPRHHWRARCGVRPPSSIPSCAFCRLKGVNLLLCAPTGRAAKRMTEATGFEAKTIHRLLEVDPKGGGFQAQRRQPARLRPARRRRNLHGRRHADAGADARGPGQSGDVDRRRISTSCLPSARARFLPTSSPRLPCLSFA